jgi:hypothetical protein
VIRGGWGIFYDRFQASNVLNAYRYDGTNQVTYLIRNPTIYDSSFSTQMPLSEISLANSQQKYILDGNLQATRLMQTVIGFERQLFSRTTLNSNFTYSRGTHELRTVDINAPLPGTYIYDANTVLVSGIRPYSYDGDIYDYQSTGTFKQAQLSIGVNTSIGKRVTLFSRYAYGHAHSDTDGLTTMPANPYNFANEWGRSSLDMRNMAFLGSLISAPWGVRISPFFIAHNGMPFNITTGTDLYGTGQLASTARPGIENVIETPYGYLDSIPSPGQSILPRNAGSGPGFLELNMRISKTWSFGTTKFEGMSGGTTARQGGGPLGGGPGGGGGARGSGGGPPGGGPGGPGRWSSPGRHVQ